MFTDQLATLTSDGTQILINQPYTLEWFDPVNGVIIANSQAEYLDFQVGGIVVIKSALQDQSKKILEDLGYPSDQILLVKELLVGVVIDSDGQQEIRKSIECLVNCQLPNGEILSSFFDTFDVISENDTKRFMTQDNQDDVITIIPIKVRNPSLFIPGINQFRNKLREIENKERQTGRIDREARLELGLKHLEFDSRMISDFSEYLRSSSELMIKISEPLAKKD